MGRIDYLKGLDYLLEAVALIKKEVEYFEVWIVGDGLYMDHLKKKSYDLNIEKIYKITWYDYFTR